MRFSLSGLLMVAVLGTAHAEDLCPEVAKQPVTEGTRMPEETFEVPAGLDAAGKLSEFLNSETLTYDFKQVVNAFVTKGVILRQQALGARVALELASAKQKNGTASAADVDKARAAAGKAMESFCAFMQDAVVAE